MRLHRHDSGQRPAGERGRELGERWSESIGAAVAAYQDHYERLGVSEPTATRIADASFDALDDWSPDLAAEVSDIAVGAGRPVRELSLLNARTEILARARQPGEGECSTAIRVPSMDGSTRQIVSFQTWDWHRNLATDALLWRYEPAPGRWVKTFTEIGMLAKIGVNSAGLAVHFNILRHDSDTDAGGVPVHAIARRILDEAATVDAAYEIARSARVGASTVISVVATGPDRAEAASIEISPAGTALVTPRADGWLTHTNHFLGDGLASGDRPPPTSTTAARLAHLDEVVSDEVGAGDLPSLARALCGSAGARAPICLTGAAAGAAPAGSAVASSTGPAAVPPSQTLLTVRLDPLAGSLECWPGTPHEAAEAGTPYHF